jgi:hypothetical protein
VDDYYRHVLTIPVLGTIALVRFLVVDYRLPKLPMVTPSFGERKAKIPHKLQDLDPVL